MKILCESSSTNENLKVFEQYSNRQNPFTYLALQAPYISIFSESPKGYSSTFGTSAVTMETEEEKGPSSTFGTGAVPMETEEERTVCLDEYAKLFEFCDGGWKERGEGIFKIHVEGPGQARLVMRSKGTSRLLTNARIYTHTGFAKMEGKGLAFACLNEGNDNVSNFAWKFKDQHIH